jgi:hypothetical protein
MTTEVPEPEPEVDDVDYENWESTDEEVGDS